MRRKWTIENITALLARLKKWEGDKKSFLDQENISRGELIRLMKRFDTQSKTAFIPLKASNSPFKVIPKQEFISQGITVKFLNGHEVHLPSDGIDYSKVLNTVALL